jgi:hypothetical protein
MSTNVLKKHEFKPGASDNVRRRPPGKKNKHSLRMGDAIIQAASRVGDENGKGGLRGLADAHLPRVSPRVLPERGEPRAEVRGRHDRRSFNMSIQYSSSDDERAALEEANIVMDAKPVRAAIAAVESHESISQESTRRRSRRSTLEFVRFQNVRGHGLAVFYSSSRPSDGRSRISGIDCRRACWLRRPGNA